MATYKEKDPDFIQVTRIEGALSVNPSTNDPVLYGDGSVEVSGTLSTDYFKSATPNHTILVRSPFNLRHVVNRPTLPRETETQLYADEKFQGRLVVVDAAGNVTDLNPLKSMGDIMTFDAVKNTTVRMPVGLPDTRLTVDSRSNFATNLAWKTDYANIFNIYEPSDGYIRYFQAFNQYVTSLDSIAKVLKSDNVARMDTDTYSVNQNGDLMILTPGMYQIDYSVNFSFSEERLADTSLAPGSTITVETYADLNGVVIPASRHWGELTYKSSSLIHSPHTVSSTLMINVPSATPLRILAKESGSDYGVVDVEPSGFHITVTKHAWNNYEGAFLMLNGSSSSSLSTLYQKVSTDNIIYEDNSDDVVNTEGSVVITQGGVRNITGKFAFITDDVPNDFTTTVWCRVLVNGVELPHGVSRITISGSTKNVSTLVSIMPTVEAGHIISMECRMENVPTTGSVAIVPDETSMFIMTPHPTQCKRSTAYLTIPHNVPIGSFGHVVLDTEETLDSIVFKKHGSIVSVLSGGTVLYTYSGVVVNISSNTSSNTSSSTALLRLAADTGYGWKEVPGSRLCTTLRAGEVSTLIGSSAAYLPPQTHIRIEAIAPDGGMLEVRFAHLSIDKHEITRSPFTGLRDFGNYYWYYTDENEVIGTSTEFSSRLTAMTINLPDGYYRLGFSFEWDMNAGGVGYASQLILDNTDVIETYLNVPVTTGLFSKETAFQRVFLTAGEHTLEFQTKVLQAGYALSTRNIRLEIWKL